MITFVMGFSRTPVYGDLDSIQKKFVWSAMRCEKVCSDLKNLIPQPEDEPPLSEQMRMYPYLIVKECISEISLICSYEQEAMKNFLTLKDRYEPEDVKLRKAMLAWAKNRVNEKIELMESMRASIDSTDALRLISDARNISESCLKRLDDALSIIEKDID
jgi:hypothetical protein